ncbi:MAG: O-antigen ligase family protein [bacterium]|nr:O-antigen ligase family protein [bacterium]
MAEVLQFPAGALAFIALVLLFYKPVWGVIAIAAIYPINLWAPRLPVPGLNTETLLVGLAMAFTFLRYGVHFPPVRYTGPVVAFIGMILFAFLLALPWVRSVQLAGGESALWKVFQIFKSMVFTSFLFFPAFWFFGDPKDRRRLIQAISFAGLTVAVFGIFDYFIPIHPKSDGSRAHGLLDDPNAMAQVIGTTMFASLYLVLHAKDLSPVKRLFHLVAYGLSGVAIVLSLSRGNWLALLASHALFLLFVNRQMLGVGFVGLVLAATIAFPFLPSIVQDRVSGVTQNRGQTVYRIPGGENLEGSAAARVVTYSVGLEMFQASPIWGHGLHYFTLKTPEWGAKYGLLKMKDAHSLPVKMAAETGLIGLAVLAWLFGSCGLHGLRLWSSNTPERGMGTMFIGVTAWVAVANLTSTGFLYTKPIAAYFWLQFGMTARAYVDRFNVSPD